jgi:hypothetical protein
MSMADELPTGKGLCESCRELKPVAWTDSLDREYCAECLPDLEVGAPSRIMEYLEATVPFQVGDRVECRTGGALYDGVGRVDDVSTELEKFGTPVYPSFHVVLEDKAYPDAPDELWYTEACLKKVASE